jgi:hypothetical protein
MEKGANVQLMLNFAFDIRKLDITNLCISSKTVNQFYLQVWNIYIFIFSFIHLLSVNLLQDTEIVISIITQEKNSSIQYILTKFVRNLYQYV